MKEIVQWTKKIGLFLAGIFLVVWGYKVNASNNAKIKQAEKEDDKTEALTPPSMFNTIELRDSTKTSSPNSNTKSKLPEKKDDKKGEKKSPSTTAPATKTKEESKTAPSTSDKSKKTETVIESDKKAEESSGTE